MADKIQACALKNTNHDTALALWQQQGDLPRGINTDALEAFWQQGSASTSDEQFREACIALEVFGELESPAEDKAARMAYQMQGLVKAKGKNGVRKTNKIAIDNTLS